MTDASGGDTVRKEGGALSGVKSSGSIGLDLERSKAPSTPKNKVKLDLKPKANTPTKATSGGCCGKKAAARPLSAGSNGRPGSAETNASVGAG